MSDWSTELDAGASHVLDRRLSDHEMDQFGRYLDVLTRWQRVQRLLGSVEPAWVVEQVFLDSLLFLRLIPASAMTLLDFGSGAGVPGIPLGIVRPERRLTLLEARQRRASFLRTAVREIGLENVTVIDARAEVLIAQNPNRYDTVVMRCAGDLPKTIQTAARLASPGGIVIASGPPRAPGALPVGDWVEVPGIRPRTTRRFAVYHLPDL